jgi:homoserine kinase
MAIALSRYLTVSVWPGAEGRENAQQADLGDGDDFVLRAMEQIAAEIGTALPPSIVRVESCIPVARGMGSSAAALLAGMLAGNALLGNKLTQRDILEQATAIEGHADNLAAALYGGGALAVTGEAGTEVVSLAINVDVRAVVLVPEWAGLTSEARAALPPVYSRSDAVYNASRCALLVHAFASGEPALLREAMRDRLHQPYRAALYPHLAATIEAALDAGCYGASLSGAGPSVLALTSTETAPEVSKAMIEAARTCGVPASTMALEIDRTGARFLADEQG